MKFTLDKGDKNMSKTLPPNTEEPSTQILHYNIYRPSSRVQCDECKRNITKGSKIMHRPQQSNSLDLCLSCFSNSQPFDGSYYVANKLNFPLLDANWSAQEELLMFEGLENHGFGNWNDIADAIGTGKTREQVEEHYQRIYLNDMSFMPQAQVLSFRTADGALHFDEPQREPKQDSKIPPKLLGTANNPPKPITTGPPAAKPSTNPAEVVGFMPRRGDFEIQYDNDAELLLAEMEFNDDDSQEDKAMKFRLMDIYNHKLDERIKRKQFVISRKLLDIREQMRLDKARTKEEKEIHNLMKVLARFNTPQDHEKLVQGIIKEKQLRQRIAELKELQSKGLRNWGDVEQELESKKKKDQRTKKRQQPQLMDKSKTRRVARKDVTSERTEKRVLYVSHEEEELCSRLNMTFRQYVAIKEKMMRQMVILGAVSLDDVSQSMQVTRPLSQAVYDFLVQQEDLEAAQSFVKAEG